MRIVFVYLAMVGFFANAEDFLSPYPAEVFTGEIFSVQTKPTFHFEMKAPQKCAASEPFSKSPQRIQCRFEEAGDREILLSVCDDGKTFCKPVKFTLKVNAKSGKTTRLNTPSPALQMLQTQIKLKATPGFEIRKPTDVLKTSEPKPVLVMISTDWCPTCNEAKEVMLSTDMFLEATADWRRIYVDGDSVESEAWKTVIPFTFYPTFALLTPDLKEVARYYGPMRFNEFQAWMTENRPFLDQPIAAVIARAEARKTGGWVQSARDFLFPAEKNRDNRRLLKFAIASQSQPVSELVQETEAEPEVLANWLRFKLSRQKSLTKEAKIDWMNKILEAGQDTAFFIEDVLALCGTDAKACGKWVTKFPARVAWWHQKKFVRESERHASLVEEFSYQSEIFKAIGDKENAKRAAQSCVEHADAQGKDSPLKVPRAAGISKSYCLGEVGRVAEAEKLYKELIETYPDEPTFYFRYANFLRNQPGRLKDAHSWAEKALANSYGYNWTKAVMLKAKIETAMKDRTEALRTIHSALNELNLNSSDPEDRDQRGASRLREMEQDLLKDRTVSSQ